MARFKCLRCGNCCSNLTNASHGLYLNHEEAKFFPKETVFPLFRNKDGVLAYQVGTKVCPNLVDGNCRIYDDRPLGCRAFPLMGTDEIDMGLCPAVMDGELKVVDISLMEEEREAIAQQLRELEMSPEPIEMYLFNLNIWISNDGFKKVS